MTTATLIRLALLGAIWGGSFLFMRVAVPSFGPPALIGARLSLAAILLATVALITARVLPWRTHWRQFLTIGALNSAIPFLLFAYAATTLPASILSIFNSLAPLFGALIGSLWHNVPVNRLTRSGLALGVLGVATLSAEQLQSARLSGSHSTVALALLAAFAAPLFYGIAATYIKGQSNPADPFSNAHGSMWTATLCMLPISIGAAPSVPPPALAWAASLVLGLVCTGAAYLLHFRLIADLGAVRALTVTFLIPVFGLLWGVAFLGEPVTPLMLLGGMLIVGGMYLTLRPTLETATTQKFL